MIAGPAIRSGCAEYPWRASKKPGGHAVLVLGNAQYDGIPIEVDKAVAKPQSGKSWTPTHGQGLRVWGWCS
jgi:hypothetical protein